MDAKLGYNVKIHTSAGVRACTLARHDKHVQTPIKKPRVLYARKRIMEIIHESSNVHMHTRMHGPNAHTNKEGNFRHGLLHTP